MKIKELHCYAGIDLGSTRTKTVFMDEHEKVLGKGITPTRGNYETACKIASNLAEIHSRFAIIQNKLSELSPVNRKSKYLMERLFSKFMLQRFFSQLWIMKKECFSILECKHAEDNIRNFQDAYEEIFFDIKKTLEENYEFRSWNKSFHFRDTVSGYFAKEAKIQSLKRGLPLERLFQIFDKAAYRVEGRTDGYEACIDYAYREVREEEDFQACRDELEKAILYSKSVKFHILNTVGTGYGRQTLPFPKEKIRSEILCHGMGASYLYPSTRTILDVGGQDMKAIQLDGEGVVTHFQMNDRCAAGCGRYLEYVADELKLSLHEMDTMALQSKKTARINSTCTVFAGAEMRERFSMGEKQEDLLAGLHHAIGLRAMSLLARSGGVYNEMTLTGGLTRNQAFTEEIMRMVKETYGETVINIGKDNVFVGAMGAAIFAKRECG